jgi:hypothetical protein
MATEMNRKIGKNAEIEICEAMKGLRGTPCKLEAERLAKTYKVGVQRIYELTKDLRPIQKERSDKGKSKWQLVEGTHVWLATQFVVGGKAKLDPKEALETAALRIEEKGGTPNLPTLNVFRQILSKHGFAKKSRTNKRVAFRRWESEFPGEIMQIDGSSLKEGFWFDTKTRKVLRIAETEVNKNHPNKNPNQVRVWQLCAVDDCTRRTYLKYIVKDKLNSRDTLEFMIEVFDDFGLPLITYTDNGGENRGRVAEATQLLNSITANSGGYEHQYHLPHNAKATGKVEVRHQFAQKMEKLICLALEEGDIVTSEKLDNFAKNICKYYNEVHINRTTGQTPMARWWSRKIVSRQVPSEVLSSALLSDIFEIQMGGDCTVSHQGKTYQIPRVRPFVDYSTSKEKLKIIVPENIEVLLVQLPCDRADEWREITKVIATADGVGEFKQVAESNTEQLRRRLKATRTEDVKAIKEKRKETGEGEAIPNWNREVKVVAKPGVLNFPQKTQQVSVADIEKIIPVASSLTSEREISYANAFSEFKNQFTDTVEAKEFLLNLFGSRDAVMLFSDVENAVKNREFIERRHQLKAVG